MVPFKRAGPCALTRFCAVCGEAFVPARRDKRFCSNACRHLPGEEAVKAAAQAKAVDLAASLIG
jgi:predicted nucleic acid-binding Zn ribbon protein